MPVVKMGIFNKIIEVNIMTKDKQCNATQRQLCKTKNPLTYKDVVGDKEHVIFELNNLTREGRKFLKWAKGLGCRWLNGEEIKPCNGVTHFHVCMHADGVLTYASMWTFLAIRKKKSDENVVTFSDFLKGFNKK